MTANDYLRRVAFELRDGALAWISAYQPLGLGNLSQYPAGSVDEPGGDSTSVVIHQGRPFSLAIEIRNDGHYGLRVLGVPVDPSSPFRARILMRLN